MLNPLTLAVIAIEGNGPGITFLREAMFISHVYRFVFLQASPGPETLTTESGVGFGPTTVQGRSPLPLYRSVIKSTL
jgi:hypothetical protein